MMAVFELKTLLDHQYPGPISMHYPSLTVQLPGQCAQNINVSQKVLARLFFTFKPYRLIIACLFVPDLQLIVYSLAFTLLLVDLFNRMPECL